MILVLNGERKIDVWNCVHLSAGGRVHVEKFMQGWNSLLRVD